jgi:hypothetical protein
MTWQRLPLCFELLSPLHVGFLPNRPGTVVASTRCYVPGKNLWGAVTAHATPWLYPNPTAAHFREVGESIREQLTFSYFYLSDGEQLFTPDYATNGLTWGNLSDRIFRARFVCSQVSTKIGEAGGAEDASLHEIEFIRHRIGSPGMPNQRVLLMGFVWICQGATLAQNALELRRESVFLNGADIFREIVLGGERNYGFGRLRRAPVPDQLRMTLSKLWPEEPETEVTVQGERPLLAHATYRQDQIFRGEVEIVAGREYRRSKQSASFRGPGEEIVNAGFFFVPGTRLADNANQLQMDSWGRLTWV